MLNASMADYLVPMAAEMPDIAVGHVVSPTADSELGAKGAGEAGTAGAAAAVANAVNDALAPFGVTIPEIPLTPEVILRAWGGSHPCMRAFWHQLHEFLNHDHGNASGNVAAPHPRLQIERLEPGEVCDGPDVPPAIGRWPHLPHHA